MIWMDKFSRHLFDLPTDIIDVNDEFPETGSVPSSSGDPAVSVRHGKCLPTHVPRRTKSSPVKDQLNFWNIFQNLFCYVQAPVSDGDEAFVLGIVSDAF